ncbi:MAG: CDP-diacylglycerol--glycerol-3-phosphate 3-phosphatidyltransferase [Atopobiaceae bacterium]|jgi:CDP-diacylglycerol--glycerol-3-phosphate 3-phosphatidyltransferase|nr:CDP-diacylglycerol--glycerol-3-phosphate 3-phosphatidyltransferase [Atopobiaceae bacterium]
MSAKSDSIWTPANVVTLVRIVLMPVWLLIAEAARIDEALMQGSAVAWASFLLFAAIALTDKLDGYLARSRGQVTNFGKFLDPIADKLCVTCAMLYLLELELVPSWAVLIILAREFIVSGLRMVVAAEGTVIAASNLGKWKTAVTMLGIGGYLLYITIPGAWTLADPIRILSHILMVAAVVLTGWSGIDYLVKCWPAISKSH